MVQFLAWQMAGPLASWGGIAVGEKRFTDAEPTRSALVGLISACLGIRREDEDNLRALSDTLGVASAVLTDPVTNPQRIQHSSSLRDYHTIQTAPPRGRKGQHNVSRRDELTPPGETILSERFYREGGIYLGCVWLRPRPLVDLQTIATAMEKPAFSLYLGRRCCPPGLPLAPRIIDSAGCDQAMQEYLADGRLANALNGHPAITRFSWDVDCPGDRPRLDQRVRRRDLTVSFRRRQFVERDEGVTIVPIKADDKQTGADLKIPTDEEMYHAVFE